MDAEEGRVRREPWWLLARLRSQHKAQPLVGSIVHRDGEEPYVDCPVRLRPTPQRECAGCERLERVSSLYDTGAVVQMVLCNLESPLPPQAGE